MKILIVDDDRNVSAVLRLIVEHYGHEVIEAGDGQEGLAKALQYKPDAIISDAMMPKMDGFQLLIAVRRDPTLCSVPFVFHTAIYTEDKEHKLALSLGADALIVKPKTPDEFWKEFTAALEVRASKKRQAAREHPADRHEEDIRNYCQMVVSKLETKVRELETTIADHDRTKKVLQESEERYRLLFENNPHPMWVFDLETLMFLAVNDAAVSKYGYSREEFLAMTIKDIRPAEDIPALLDKVSLSIEGFDAAGTWRHRKKDGTIFDVEITAHGLDFGGRRAKLILAVDVTERRRMEKAIRDASDEWRSTFDAMSDAIALLDRDGKILRCNKAMAVLAGKDYREIIGRPCWEVVQGASGPVDDCPHETMKKSRHRETVEIQFSKRRFDATVDPMFDNDGDLIGAVHIMVDITERKRAEEALRTSEEMHRLIFQNSPVGIFHYDADLIITECNDRFIKLLNSKREKLIGLDMHILKDQRVLPSLEMAIKGEEGRYEDGYQATTSSAKIWVSMYTAPLFNKDGTVRGGIGIVEDISERKRTEKLIENQKRFAENLIQNSAIATFVLDSRHNVLIWSRACEELTGMSASVIIGSTDQWKPFYAEQRPVMADVILDQDVNKLSFLYPEYSKSVLTPEGLHGEGWFGNLNSKMRYIVFDAAPIRDSAGNIIAAIETLQDFTDRKKLEDQIIQAQREWEETFNTITDMVTVHDKDFNIIRANKAAEKILGLSFLEVKKTKCFEHYHGTSCPPEGCPSCQSLVTGKPSSSELFEPHLNMFIEIRAIPRVNSNGGIEGLIHVVRDISERKRDQDTLERYSKQLTALNTASNTLLASTSLKDIYQEICNIIFAVFDLNMVWLGIIEEGNYEVKPVAHAGREDGYLSAIKVTWDDYSPTGKGPSGTAIRTRKPSVMSTDDPSFAPWRTEAKKRGYASRMAVPLLSAAGNCIGVLNFYGEEGSFTPDSMKLTQIFANQAAIAIENARLIVGLEEKVTERTRQIEDTNIELQSVNRELVLRREEAEAGSRSKSDFLANMSHELRTPLNAVIGLSQVLLEQTFGPLNVKQSEYLDGVRQSGNHLLSLINEILDLSKIEAGKEQFEPAVFSMSDAVRSAFMLVKEKAMKHGIELSHEIGLEVGLFYADERRVKQILFNLLSNAVKFTEPGGKVGLKARMDERAFTLTVWDTGVGIPENKRHLIFQPFQQLDSSLSRKHEGTGLGLVLSKRLVEMHGGTIAFESREGGGTNFTVTLPVMGAGKTAARQGIEESRAVRQSEGGAPHGKKVLVVEDNQLNMLLASDFLKNKSFEVMEAVNGEMALEKAAQERPDLILLDIQMPGIDGFEVLRRLRGTPALKDLPVIAMTALAMKGDEERCMRAGFNDYVGKPIDLQEMLNKIIRILESGSRD